MAIGSQDIPIILSLVHAGADINFILEEGSLMTPMHIAVLMHNPEVVRIYLSSSRPYLNSPNAAGRTPLDLAKNSQDYEIVGLLMEKKEEENE